MKILPCGTQAPTQLEEMNTFLEASDAKASIVSSRPQANPLNQILIVDDDADLRRLHTQVLAFAGYQVAAAEDGEAAWEYLKANSYDLLITDHRMPRSSGLELIRKLRSANMTLPVIMASGSATAEGLSRNDRLQLAATLSKPFTPSELLDTVTRVLRVANSSRPSGGVSFPVLAEALSHVAPRSHWGINE
jgi:DNA-binding response OmpR family regulator